MTKYFTGVGSRSTPTSLMDTCSAIASFYTCKGYTLRSGAAPGADDFFESGSFKSDIYIPWNGFNKKTDDHSRYICPIKALDNWDEALDILCQVRPDLKRVVQNSHNLVCKDSYYLLHGRNVYQVLGHDLNTPSDFLACWTPNGKCKGGTATAIKLADKYDIPIYNIAIPEELESLREYGKALLD